MVQPLNFLNQCLIDYEKIYEIGMFCATGARFVNLLQSGSVRLGKVTRNMSGNSYMKSVQT